MTKVVHKEKKGKENHVEGLYKNHLFLLKHQRLMEHLYLVYTIRRIINLVIIVMISIPSTL
jgi:hypothetical protein